ncbi:MAG: hypothetical protein IT353_04325 [Gemmatimonadaceae bacterium]|nr:hypothetical protein [Gemmatimonadaceae bacterium]
MTARVFMLLFSSAGLVASALGAQVVPSAAATSARSPTSPAPEKVVRRAHLWMANGQRGGGWTEIAVASRDKSARVSINFADGSGLGVIAWSIAEGECGGAGRLVAAKRAAPPVANAGSFVVLATAPALDDSKDYSFFLDWMSARVANKKSRRGICLALAKDAATH